MNKKLTEQEQKLLYLNDKKYYDRLIAETMAMTPRLRDNYESLNKVFPRFFTTDLLKKLEMFCNILTKRKDYYLFWTAYLLENSHTKRKLIKEYETFIKTKTA